MYRLLLSFVLALPLLATACSGPGCRDACDRLVRDCGMLGKGKHDMRVEECVDACRETNVDDEEIECVAEMECSHRAFDRCFTGKHAFERWHDRYDV
jgi:hypothetical protein